MDTSDAGPRDEHLDEPDSGPAPGALPVEPADNGEPVMDPDADEDAAGRAAAAGAERIERHQGDKDGS